MTTVIDTMALMLDRNCRGVLKQLEGLTDEQLNRSLTLPETNTLYQLATHVASSAEYWVLTMVGRRPTARDRDTEFRSAGSLTSLQARFEALIQETQELLSGLSPADLDRRVEPPSTYETPLFSRQFHGTEPLTVGYCLLHSTLHGAVHVGHMQVTRQLLAEIAR